MKKNIIFIFAIVIVIGFAVWWQSKKVESPAVKITNFKECAAAGNPIAESYPRQCRHAGQLFVEEVVQPISPPVDIGKEILCSAESRMTDVCATVIDTVCATVEIQCIKAPCNPVKNTFNNSCEACRNSLVKSYIKGECQISIVN